MSRAACKEIIDSGGMIQGLADSFATTSKTQAQSLGIFGVAETPEGDEWLEKVKVFQAKARTRLQRLNEEAMELCMSQPLA